MNALFDLFGWVLNITVGAENHGNPPVFCDVQGGHIANPDKGVVMLCILEFASWNL